MKVKQVSVMVDLAPLLMNISLMVFIDTAIILENLSCVFKHYNACISLHTTCRYSLVENHIMCHGCGEGKWEHYTMLRCT